MVIFLLFETGKPSCDRVLWKTDPTPPRLKWAARRKKQTRLVVQKSFDLPYETLNILKDSKQIRFDVNLVY